MRIHVVSQYLLDLHQSPKGVSKHIHRHLAPQLHNPNRPDHRLNHAQQEYPDHDEGRTAGDARGSRPAGIALPGEIVEFQHAHLGIMAFARRTFVEERRGEESMRWRLDVRSTNAMPGSTAEEVDIREKKRSLRDTHTHSLHSRTGALLRYYVAKLSGS